MLEPMLDTMLNIIVNVFIIAAIIFFIYTYKRTKREIKRDCDKLKHEYSLHMLTADNIATKRDIQILRSVISIHYRKNNSRLANLNLRAQHFEHLFSNIKREYPTVKEVGQMISDVRCKIKTQNQQITDNGQKTNALQNKIDKMNSSMPAINTDMKKHIIKAEESIKMINKWIEGFDGPNGTNAFDKERIYNEIKRLRETINSVGAKYNEGTEAESIKNLHAELDKTKTDISLAMNMLNERDNQLKNNTDNIGKIVSLISEHDKDIKKFDMAIKRLDDITYVPPVNGSVK